MYDECTEVSRPSQAHRLTVIGELENMPLLCPESKGAVERKRKRDVLTHERLTEYTCKVLLNSMS